MPEPQMSVLVVGSVAYDSVKTSAGERTDSLGGAATYFSLAASYFCPVSMVAVVGDDFRDEHVEMLRSHDVDTFGLVRKPGKTFRWSGVYDTEDVNTRETLDTQLNVFADFSPELSPAQRRTPYVFLANINPELQLDVLGQMEVRPKMVALDTMNFWIEGSEAALMSVVRRADVVFVDEGEARQLASERNLVRAARRIQNMGPATVVIKRGEHGVLVLQQDGSLFVSPTFPLETVVDPTGAGDSFAGGFVGYLAATGDLSPDRIRRAAVLGCVMGSFNVESFSTERVDSLTHEEIETRFRSLADLSHFPPLGAAERLPSRNKRYHEVGNA